MRFENDGNLVVDIKYHKLYVECKTLEDAEELVKFLNEQQNTLDNARKMNRRLATKLEEGFDYS